jgi:hypothetical protein
MKPGTQVSANTVVCRLENIEVSGNVDRAAADRDMLELQTRIEQTRSADGASISEKRLQFARALYTQAERDRDGLVVRAPSAGTVLDVRYEGQPGSFIHKGEHVATVMWGDWIVRCLATAEDLADMEAHVGKPVRIRVRADSSESLEGTIASISAMGTKQIVSPALTHVYGGEIPVSPQTGESAEAYFEIVIHIDADHAPQLRYGMTARIFYETSREAYGRRLVRKYRQFVNKLLVM